MRKCYCAQVLLLLLRRASQYRCTALSQYDDAVALLTRARARAVAAPRAEPQLTQAEAYYDADNYALCANIVGKERHVTMWEWAYALLACATNLTALPAAREAVRSQRHVSRRDHDRWLLFGTFGVVLTNAVGMLLVVYLPPGWIQKQVGSRRDATRAAAAPRATSPRAFRPSLGGRALSRGERCAR